MWEKKLSKRGLKVEVFIENTSAHFFAGWDIVSVVSLTDFEVCFFCNLFSECLDGRYGPNCQFICSCTNGASCDPTTGSCNCIDQWIGPTCEQGKHLYLTHPSPFFVTSFPQFHRAFVYVILCTIFNRQLKTSKIGSFMRAHSPARARNSDRTNNDRFAVLDQAIEASNVKASLRSFLSVQMPSLSEHATGKR